MSLQYIIDAYNLINHRQFKAKPSVSIQLSLINFLKIHRLTGSKNNRVILVFDGFPPANSHLPEEEGLFCIFSRKLEADEIIKRIIEKSPRPENIIVVSDDKAVQTASRMLRANFCAVEEFLLGKRKNAVLDDPGEEKLTYSQVQKINTEFKKLWLDS
ncbi:MAG: NYN domain-containing protein [Candidatus Omnitrophica bacterium]|nr:NYN domain-containing protein [Candidatus Omnitrophota bacterium]